MTSIFDQTSTSFDEVDRAPGAATFPGYLDRMALDLARLKQTLHALLAVRPGEAILDVGCGTGADVRSLAGRVGPLGRVVGVDNSRLLVEEARAQTQHHPMRIEYREADAHDLPFPTGTFDAVRCERVMMHVADPARVLAELVRVVKPGGRVLVVDPDHGMWALDHPHVEVTRSLLTWWFNFITNPWQARRTPALMVGPGLTGIDVSVHPVLLRDLESADAMTGIGKAAGAALAQGVLTAQQRDDFDAELAAGDRDGRFLMCGAMIASLARRS